MKSSLANYFANSWSPFCKKMMCWQNHPYSPLGMRFTITKDGLSSVMVIQRIG